MSKLWSRVGVAALATVFLAACGTTDTPSQGAGNADVATGGAQFSTADTETAKLGSDAEPGFPWKENFLLVGDALGEEDAAVETLNEYQARADEVRASIDESPTISLVRFM